jgi:hypothetical protein
VTALRRAAASLCLVLATAAGLVALALIALDGLAGSAGAASTTAVAAATNPTVDAAIATSIISDVSTTGSPAQSSFRAHRSVVVHAVSAALATPTVDQLIRADVAEGYRAVVDGRSATIDLRPLTTAVTKRVHEVDPTVPATPVELAHPTLTIRHPRAIWNVLRDVNVLSWTAAGLWLALALAAARFLLRRGWGRYSGYAVATLLPIAFGLALGAALPHAISASSVTGANARTLVRHFASVVGSSLIDHALWFLLAAGLGALVLVLTDLPSRSPSGPPAPLRATAEPVAGLGPLTGTPS